MSGAGPETEEDRQDGRFDRPALGELSTTPVGAVFAAMRTTPQGLDPAQASARYRADGPNTIPAPRGRGLIRGLLAQISHLFALMLWLAAGLAFVAGMPELGWAVIVVVVVNGGFSFVQEHRAERATRALAALLPERASVVRGGRRAEVSASELVRGDVVLLREGDAISADARIVTSHGLEVEHSVLTGESQPLPRTAEPLAEPPPDPVDAPNLVFAGTHVTRGSGTAVVAATGQATRLGGISRMTGEVVRRPSPLHQQLNRTVRVVGALALVAGLAFLSVSLSMGMDLGDAFVFAMGVIVALVPEGLLPTFTLSLARGATRMAERGALVRHLEAVETLGATTVICTDKTGTITANEMTAVALWLPGRTYSVTGWGYDPGGTILLGERPLAARERSELAPLLRAAALCGDARVELRAERWRCAGDPTEGALLVLARKGGVEREAAERGSPRIAEFPFDSDRRRMSTVHMLPSGSVEVVAKGSPESILPACTSLLRAGGPAKLDGAGERELLSGVDRMAVRGLRVIAFARRELPKPPATAAAAERELQLLGLVGLADPVRPEVPDAIARCRRAGIRVVMVTGDHPATAMAVGREAGLPVESVMLGSELPDDDRALAELLGTHVSVLARVTPEQKLRIAQALQTRGEVVAMTGDGVNDAPALRQADIGVAMGRSGTDVARRAADLVLLDDNFAHIVEAVEEGRATFDNMRRFLTYVLTSNVPELAPFLAWALSGGSIPLALTVLQILAVDLGTDLLPALALGGEPPHSNVMMRRPRSAGERLLDRATLLRAYGFLGPLEAMAALAMIPAGAALAAGWRPGQALPAGPALSTMSTMVWAAIVMAQVGNGIACRSRSGSALRTAPLGNRLLLAAMAIEVATMLALVNVPGIRDVFGHSPLGLAEWAVVVLAAPTLLFAEELRKLASRRRGGAGRARRPGRVVGLRSTGPAGPAPRT
ncbi:MAG: cation-transporting P-type ATPase [Actinobacteria bacterium]|nr:cation-transporting P-type ATPase [Actinomycetota bacterium]